ncbi:MAG TPA: flagellar basal body-associated FliL family protein [Candidatus Tectomicrobia bacterium]
MATEVADGAATQPKKRSLGKILLLGLNLLLFLAGAAFFFLTKFGVLSKPATAASKEPQAHSEPAESHPAPVMPSDHSTVARSESHGEGVTVPLQPFVVNLSGDDGHRFLRLVLALEVKDEKTKAEIDKRLPHLRHRLVFLLTGKTFADIGSAQGKYQLQTEINKALNETLGAPLVRKTYFTEFIVQ